MTWTKAIALAIALVGGMCGFVALIGLLAESRSWWGLAGLLFALSASVFAVCIKASADIPSFPRAPWPK